MNTGEDTAITDIMITAKGTIGIIMTGIITMRTDINESAPTLRLA